jgi:hypothetical protein
MNRRVPLVLFSLSACITTSGELGAVDSNTSDGSGSGPGTSGDDDGASGVVEDDGSGSGGVVPDECLGVIDVGPGTQMMLGPVRVANSISDLFGIQIVFNEPVVTDISQVALDVSQQVDVAALCGANGVEFACLEPLAADLGLRVWRRPLTEEEIAALVAALPEGSPEEGVREIVRLLIDSQNFWAQIATFTPHPTDPELVVLDNWSIATRMAAFLWNSTPDQTLLDRAATDDLTAPEVRQSELDRMLADPRSERAVSDYYEELMGTTLLETQVKDEELFPAYDAGLAAAMRQEVRLTSLGVFTGTANWSGTWQEMLTTTESFVNGALASAAYADEIVGEVPGEEFALVSHLPERRHGIVSLAGPMARWSHGELIGLVHRGLWMRQNVMCTPIPAPPGSVDTSIPHEPDGDTTRYEWRDEVISDAACKACHDLTDPVTFAFDHYDPIGRWQDEIGQAGSPPAAGGPLTAVDTHGALLESGLEFAGLEELVQIVLTEEQHASCPVQRHVSFAAGRELENEDACTVAQLTENFLATGGHLPTLVRDVVMHESFVLARPEEE